MGVGVMGLDQEIGGPFEVPLIEGQVSATKGLSIVFVGVLHILGQGADEGPEGGLIVLLTADLRSWRNRRRCR